MDESKTPADDAGTTEGALHLLRFSIGSDIEVFGPDAEQQITNGAADEECLEACLL